MSGWGGYMIGPAVDTGGCTGYMIGCSGYMFGSAAVMVGITL